MVLYEFGVDAYAGFANNPIAVDELAHRPAMEQA